MRNNRDHTLKSIFRQIANLLGVLHVEARRLPGCPRHFKKSFVKVDQVCSVVPLDPRGGPKMRCGHPGGWVAGGNRLDQVDYYSA